MRVFLNIIGVLSLLSAVLAGYEVITLSARPNPTVFQQLALLVQFGFSVLTMVCAFGFAAVAAGRDT